MAKLTKETYKEITDWIQDKVDSSPNICGSTGVVICELYDYLQSITELPKEQERIAKGGNSWNQFTGEAEDKDADKK